MNPIHILEAIGEVLARLMLEHLFTSLVIMGMFNAMCALFIARAVIRIVRNI